MTQPAYYEFFAGGGMARAGLGPKWRCLFANDHDRMKADTYAANWGVDDFVYGDVAALAATDLPARADLAWASFPCQDLSLAGDGAGLGIEGLGAATRSGTFWPFMALMRELRLARRAPRLIVLENVYGALTSHQGRDFAAIGTALVSAGYRFGAVVINAASFVPQSRPRVFFLAVDAGYAVPSNVVDGGPRGCWHPKTLVSAYAGLPHSVQKHWIWWDMPVPSGPVAPLAAVIEEEPVGVTWHSAAETARILDMMSPLNRQKGDAARASGVRQIGCVYRRTRPDPGGVRRQRAEIRFDGVAGCLRTPGGGSSRQTIVLVDGQTVRSRLLAPREAARLMGLDDSYRLPARTNDALHVTGDGVCPPVVRHLARFILEPVLASTPYALAAA